MTPLFSVITVTYNAADNIGPTMESVRNQTCRLYEHLIIDGASSDNTVQLAREASTPLTRIMSEPDHGLYDAMNKGLAEAQGDYVVFLNAGDRFHSPATLQLIADKILDNDYPGVVYGQTDIIDASGKKIGERHLRAPENLTLADFAEGMVVCHQAFVVLRRITSSFNTAYRFSADYEWCIRCLQHSHNNVYSGEVIADYLSEGISTANRRRSLQERFKIMCKYFGVGPTVKRHFSFLPRYIRQRRLEKLRSGSGNI